jgi:hypothetical protein
MLSRFKPRFQRKKPDSDIHVFGVDHTTGPRGRVHRRVFPPNRPEGKVKRGRGTTTPTAHVTALLRELKRAGGPERITSEMYYYDFDPENETHRFTKAFDIRAKKRGIDVVKLEPAKIEHRRLNDLEHFLWDIATLREEPGKTYDKMRAYYETTGTKPRVIELIANVHERFPRMTRDTLFELLEAIGVHRSLRHYEDTKEAGIKHMVVGSLHAYDLKQLKHVKTTYVSGNPSARKNRLLHYEKYKDFIAELERIARPDRT